MIDAEKEFPRVANLLYSLAWRAHHVSGLPFEDLRSEAFVAFMKCCESYNGKAGTKFSTWLHFKVTCHLKTWTMRQKKNQPVYVDEIHDEMLPDHMHVKPGHWAETVADKLRHISDEARELARLIMECPETGTPASIFRAAMRDFTFNRGVDDVYVRILAQEVSAGLRGEMEILEEEPEKPEPGCESIQQS